jgi:hypothetical protein
MKKNHILFAAAGLFFATNAFAALTVTLTQDAYSSGNGGEFNAVITGGNYTPYYNSSPTTQTTFGSGIETFCIDTSHYFNPGTTYNATIGSTTYAGSGNQISAGTAFLYSQFAAGTLAGYNYTLTGNARNTSAGLLENTLWALEGEISSTGIFVTGNQFYNDLISKYGTIAAAEADAGVNNYGVGVLELTTASGAIAQSQLIETLPPGNHTSSVPEPSTVVAGALLLLPFGVSTLRILRKKNAAAE